MVVKTIVVRNLFSFEYEGSNPSLPTIEYKETCILFLHKNKQMFKKGEIMNFKSNKEKGNSGLGMAIAYFTTKGKEYKTVVNTNVDYIFILDAEQKMYLLPKKDIVNKSTINLGRRTEKYRVNI